jgi:mono/diheme cytochrome c family protein
MILGVAIATPLAVMALTGCGHQGHSREIRDFERMRRQKRYDSYEASSYFANGAVMQAPPAHTVSVEQGLSLSDTAEPTATTITLATGARQYAISCAICHGNAGYGGGRMAANLTERRPPSLRSPAVAALPWTTLLAIITNGNGTMPPLGWQLAPPERRAVAAYVRTLPRIARTDEMIADARADSAMADYLHRIDSLHASGAPITTIVQLPRPSNAPRRE